jgi:peptidoglycan hydrolase-like protein with peptidoglycan-binding domain
MANDRHPTIKVGSKGAAVKLAQTRLNARGYAAGTADGLFGNLTRNAVKSYQADRAQHTVAPLQSDGVVGPKTWARLDPPVTKKGDDGPAVKLLQERLNVFSFLFEELDVDGDFGAGTEAALKAFQEWWGTLAVDGVAGALTWTALWS